MFGWQLRPGRYPSKPVGAVNALAAALFRNGEQGWWFDNSDLSTLFQDAAGTTPVTAAGQPVGLQLDKHASDGRGVVNLLPWSEQFDNGAWGKINVTLSSNAIVAPNGVLAADLAVANTVTGRHEVNPNPRQFPGGKIYTASIYVKYAGTRYFSLVYTSGGSACFDLQAGVVTDVSGGTATVVLAAEGFLRCTFTFTGANATGAVYNCLRKTPGLGVETYAGDGTSGVYIWGAQLEAGSATTAYQKNTATVGGPGNHRFQVNAASRPILRQNATTGAYYLETDGSDDWMQTNSINFTSTDKVTLFTGVRKLSDAALGMLAELSASFGANGGAFGLTAPASVGLTYYAGVSQAPGTFRTATVVGFPAPRSDVLTASLVCSATTDAARVRLRVGGIEHAPTYAGLAGAAVAAFGNYPAYFFRRGGTTLPFNGHEYGSICVGRLCTAAEITAVERLMAQRTGVTLA